MTLIRSIEADLKVVKAEILGHPEFDVTVLHRSIRSKLTARPHILNLIMGSCHAVGQSGFDDARLLRLVNIVIAGIQPVDIPTIN